MVLHGKSRVKAEGLESNFNAGPVSFSAVYPQRSIFLTSLALFICRKKKCHPQMFKTCIQPVKINVQPAYGNDNTRGYECRKGISCLTGDYLPKEYPRTGITGKQRDCDACRYCDPIENA